MTAYLVSLNDNYDYRLYNVIMLVTLYYKIQPDDFSIIVNEVDDKEQKP